MTGMRVVELASEATGFAGLLLAGLGAAVTVVEPPGGSPTRRLGPFADDEPGPERSLWWRYYNRGKEGAVLDLTDPELHRLVAGADVVLEGEADARLTAAGLDRAHVTADHPRLVWVSITPFGRGTSRADEPATDLTLLADAGVLWSCGYDDRSLPPVRGGEGHAAHLAGHQAVIGTLVALLARQATGRGQLVDVSMHATANLMTEGSTYEWLVRRATVQRQTGRHAMVEPTQPTQVAAADGRHVNTGVPKGDAPSSGALLRWLDELGVREEAPEVALLELAAAGELPLDIAEVRAELVGAQRSCTSFIAGLLGAQEFFVQAQERGFSVGVVNAAEDVLADPQLRARGAWEDVEEPVLGRVVTYPAAAIAFGDGRVPLAAAPSLDAGASVAYHPHDQP